MAESGGSAPASEGPSVIGVLSSESDEDEEVVKAKAQADYYDDKLDEQDEAWAVKQRQGRISDAILTCPACFTTLCIDCQRHEKYVHQYRAMFVQNCKIVDNEILRLPPHRQGQGRKNRKNKRKGAPEASTETINAVPDENDVFKPVRCSVCETEVAVIDKDEVYHFFNIMPSYS